MERRAHIRQSINFDVIISATGIVNQTCTGMDFCIGGMLLIWKKSALRANPGLAGLERGDSLLITVNIPNPITRKETQYFLEASVSRLDECRLGLAFIHPDPDAIRALQSLASASAQSVQERQHENEHPKVASHHNAKLVDIARQKYSPAREGQVLNNLLPLVENFLSEQIKLYFSGLEERLIDSAERAKDNAEQNTIFESMGKLNKAKSLIGTQISTNALNPFTDYANDGKFDLSYLKRDTGASKISLIDKTEFEDWLVIKVMVSKAEVNNKEALTELQLRFRELSGLSQGVQNNPVSPAVICSAFNEAFSSIPLSAKVKKISYAFFELKFVSALKDLYQQLNQQLDQDGILRDFDIADHLMGVIPNRPAQKVPDHLIKEPEPKPASEAGPESSDLSRADTAAAVERTPNATSNVENFKSKHNEPRGQGQPALENNKLDPNIQGQSSTLSAYKEQLGVSPSEHTSSVASFELQQRVARNAADTVIRLIDVHRSNSASFVYASPLAEDNAKNLENLPIVEKLEFAEKLSDLQAQDVKIDDQAGLHERILVSLNSCDEEKKVLGEEESSAVSVVERLFDSILNLETLSDNVRPLIKQLEIPFLKLLLQKSDFLQDVDHPARQVLNSVAKLGMKGTISTGKNTEVVEGILKKIVTDFDDDISVFNSANHELESLINRQERVYEKNIDRVKEAAKGQFKVRSARKYVDECLEEKIGGNTVPKAILKLLDAGWKELLVLTRIREGADSSAWHEYIGVVDRLLAAGDPNQKKPELPTLLKSIKTGLNLVTSSGEFNDEQTIASLKALLTAEREQDKVLAPMVEVPRGSVDSNSLGLDQSDEHALWLKRAKKMAVGTWLELLTSDDEELVDAGGLPKGDAWQQMRLAWVDEDADDFIFVNHQGLKVVDMNADELADLLSQQKAKIIDDLDQPVVNLGLDRMVQKFYGQLAHHASHDELTGLLNRREFEKRVRKLLKESREKNSEHVLACFDLDEIKTVNDQCGYDAGDELLKQISKLIQKQIPNKTDAARISGDRFALLLPNVNLKTSHIIIKNLLKSISAFHFDWSDEVFSISSAVGIVQINNESESISSLFKSAATACEKAKASSSDTALYTWERASASSPESNDLWADRLNKAIQEDRLELRCQKIKSLGDLAKPDQYEMLLAMRDESGQEVSASDFIHAAESCDKMPTLDRWVIKNVLSWMNSVPDKVKSLGGCSINLSGHSLNDENLLEFIFEHFVKLDKVPRSKVCFEVTETTAIENVADVADFIQEMQQIGCQFSLDDFGSESSSYHFLKNLPVDYIKIDGAFVKDMVENQNDFAMVKSINEMGHFMGKQTIAEHVENKDVLAKLEEIGVDFAQGYCIERPVSLSSL